jgi:hypothetical protein
MKKTVPLSEPFLAEARDSQETREKGPDRIGKMHDQKNEDQQMCRSLQALWPKSANDVQKCR